MSPQFISPSKTPHEVVQVHLNKCVHTWMKRTQQQYETRMQNILIGSAKKEKETKNKTKGKKKTATSGSLILL